MRPITPRQKLKRLDFLDYIMTAVFFILVGIMVGAYNKDWSGFFEQNWVITLFIAITIGIRPVVRFFR